MHRRVIIPLVLALVVLTLGTGLAQAKKKKTKVAPPPPDLPGQVSYYARQLWGVPLDESEPITSKVQTLVLDHLQVWFANRKPGDSQQAGSEAGYPIEVRVRRELEHVFSQLHYPFFGQPSVFAASWKGTALIGAGYTLGWTDYDRANVVALFEIREGKTRLAAVTNFVPRTDLHYEIVSTPGSDDFRFFVYGTRLGKSHLRLSAILYAFDGSQLKSQWETRDVYDGKMDVDGEKVVIRYLKEEEYVREVQRRRKPPRHEAIYKITPQGLDLETDHEIPF